MKRSLFVAGGASLLGMTLAQRAARAEDGSYDLATLTGTIYGTLSFPAGGSKPAVVLIIAGSGATDRNCNGPGIKTDAYLLLAQALAARGFASVRYDKRGIAASRAAGPSEANLRFDDYIADAEAWTAQLRNDGRFGKIAIAGHSEGSLIGMIAAQRAGVDAFVSLDGAGRPAADVLRSQLQPKLALAPDLHAANERILNALIHGQTVDDVPSELLVLYRPSVQPYLISWFRFDPRTEIAKLTGPVTIIQGTADLQVPVDDAKALSAAHPGATLVLIDGMSHVLKHASDASPAAQVQTVYVDPSIPIEPLVPATIAAALP